MKKNILKAAAMLVSLAVAGVLACGGSSGGCGQSQPTTNTSQATLPCGTGTVQQNGECVLASSAGGTSGGTTGSGTSSVSQKATQASPLSASQQTGQ